MQDKLEELRQQFHKACAELWVAEYPNLHIGVIIKEIDDLHDGTDVTYNELIDLCNEKAEYGGDVSCNACGVDEDAVMTIWTDKSSYNRYKCGDKRAIRSKIESLGAYRGELIICKVVARFIDAWLQKILLIQELPIPRDVAELIAQYQLVEDVISLY